MFKRIALTLCVLCFSLSCLNKNSWANHGDDLVSKQIARHSNAMVFGDIREYQEAVAFVKKRGNPDMVVSLIASLRFRPGAASDILDALQSLTGHMASTWAEWMQWQEDNTDLKPHPSFIKLKRDILENLDPRYGVFFRHGWNQPEDMRIRLEEIVWGGPKAMDGIPSLDHPKMMSAIEATYMKEDDLVFGIEINGDVRAYPLRILGWHEMFNDVIGGVPVALAYCTLCGSGILYEGTYGKRQKPFIFGSSGMLYRSNKLMFDWETLSLWNQFTGEPVVGPLAHSGIRLITRPVAIVEWKDWKASHPQTTVLDINTGHKRDYGSGAVYRDYFASPNLMFPTSVRKSDVFKKKDFVFGIRDFGAAKAWPVKAFTNQSIINDKIGDKNIVLVGNAKTRTVRAYERDTENFESASNVSVKSLSGETWAISEAMLTGPNGQKLRRIAGVLSYWFAWDGYMGLKSEYYSAKN